MSTQPLDQPVLDLTILRQQFGDDDDLLREVVLDYREQRREIVAQIHRAFERGNLNAVAEHTHQLKGSLLTLGAQAAARAASELEALARRRDDAGVRAVLPRFEHELDVLAPELDHLIEHLG